MIDDPVFLTVEHILAIHERVIVEFGGTRAVRDRGLLESAAMIPAARYGGAFLHVGLSVMAAAYLFHLCRNHPFADGNKRTALASAELFLLLNDHELTAPNRRVESLVLGVAEGSISKDSTVSFFREHTRRRPASRSKRDGLAP